MHPNKVHLALNFVVVIRRTTEAVTVSESSISTNRDSFLTNMFYGWVFVTMSGSAVRFICSNS